MADMTFGTYKIEALSTRFNAEKFNIVKGNKFCRFNVKYVLPFEGSTSLFMLHIRRIKFGEWQVIVKAID